MGNSTVTNSTTGRKSFLDRINPNDWGFLGYIIVTAVIISIFHANLDSWFPHILGRAIIGFVFFFIVRYCSDTPNKFLLIIRYWYPVFSFTFFYMESGSLNQIVFSGYLDDIFSGLDIKMFGVHPNIWLYDHFNNFYMNEFMHLCYFLYYILPIIFGVIIYRDRITEYFRMVFAISVTFYICYTLYIFIPAAGPLDLRQGRFTDGGWFVHIMNWIYTNGEKPGAAFPSSHVAIALMALMYMHHLHRRIFWAFLPFIAGLILSTVYGFYHYVVDALFGALLCVISFYVCNWLFDKYLINKFPAEWARAQEKPK
jgi:membrane-associated phospholipid phosphatase